MDNSTTIESQNGVKSNLYNQDDLSKIERKAKQMAKDAIENEYQRLDKTFIDANKNIVIMRRGENIRFFDYVDGVYKQISDIEIEQAVDKLMDERGLLPCRTRSKIADTVARIAALLSRTTTRVFTDKKIEKQGYLINFTNGLLDPATGVMIEHTPSYFTTNQLQFPYDADAVPEEFEQFVRTVSNGDDQVYEMIQDMFGYIICANGNPKHKVFYLSGETARNGKTTTAKLLCGILGDSNYSVLSTEQLSKDGFHLSQLVGKKLNFSDETSSRYIESSQIITMSAEGIIPISEKYKPSYSYAVTCNFVFTCNDIPRFSNAQGMYHRTIIIPFKYQIPEGKRIERYEEKLLEKEGSAIINWAIEGYKKLQARGGFLISDQSKNDVYEVKKDSNSALAFLEDCFEFSEEYKNLIPTTDLYGYSMRNDSAKIGKGYARYCEMTGSQPMKLLTFAKELSRFADETKKIVRERNNRERGFIGMRYRDHAVERGIGENEQFSDLDNGAEL